MNTKYSFKDFTGQILTGEPAVDFDGDIIGANFAQEGGLKDVFPADATGTLIRCNVDNCNKPAGMTFTECSNREIDTKNDLEDWICVGDGNKTPVEPIRKTKFLEFGLSIDPVDIPAEKLSKSVVQTKEEELEV